MKQMFIEMWKGETLKGSRTAFSTGYDDFINESCIIKVVGL